VHGLVPGEAGGSLGRRLVGDLVDAKLMLSLDDRYLSLCGLGGVPPRFACRIGTNRTGRPPNICARRGSAAWTRVRLPCRRAMSGNFTS